MPPRTIGEIDLHRSGFDVDLDARSAWRDVPVTPGVAVVRANLIERLDAGAAVTIVQAPPGSGKTTALAMWARRRLEEGAKVRWMRAPTSTTSVRSFALALLSASARKEFADPSIIVIDEVDEPLDDPSTQTLLETVARHPRLRLVIAGRRARSIEPSAHRARLDTSLVQPEELLVTHQDVEEFATAWGKPMDAAAAADLLELTGGWIEPMRLALLRRRDRSSSAAAASRWVRNVIDEGLRPDLLETAARLSLLRRIDSGTIRLAFVDGSRSDGDDVYATDIVNALRALGLVHVHVGDADLGMRMPEIVRRVLHDKTFALDSARLTSAHVAIARAALKLDPRSFAREILEHASRGQAWDVLARFWFHHGLQALSEYPVETREAFSLVPEPLLRSSSTLAIARYVATFDDRDAFSPERSVLLGFSHAEIPTAGNLSRYGSVDDLIESVVIRMVQLRAAGAIQEAYELSLEAEREVANRQRAGGRQPSPINASLFLVLRSMTSLLEGNDWGSAAELASRALALSGNGSIDFVASNASGYRALLDALAGWSPSLPDVRGRSRAGTGVSADIAAAMAAVDALDEETAKAAVELIWPHVRGHELWPYIAVAWGRYSLIFEPHDTAAERLREIMWRHPDARTAGGAARMAIEALNLLFPLRSGRANLAQRAIDEARGGSVWMTVGSARLRLSTGEYDRALREGLAGASDAGLGNRERASLLFIAAASALQLGDTDGAIQNFLAARRVADSNGLLGTYTMISHEQRGRLFELSGTSLHADHAARLERIPDVYPDGIALVTLSAREHEVLRALANHETHRAVAEELYISVATARTHIQTLYSKLGVRERAAAIARSAELGLL